MNKKSPAFSSGNRLQPFLGFLRTSGNKGWDYITLGTVGVFILAIIIVGFWMWSATKIKIHYTPADIVYGVEIHAVHDMGTNNNSRASGNFIAPSSGKPEIRISEKYYDFGDVDAHQVLTRTFVIANYGQSPLIIQRAYTTCGCTMADFTAAEIPPGKVALMTLRFDTGFHDMRGTTVRRGVMIETNDPDHPIQEIWIQASVR
jgi:hypothetical protein